MKVNKVFLLHRIMRCLFLCLKNNFHSRAYVIYFYYLRAEFN